MHILFKRSYFIYKQHILDLLKNTPRIQSENLITKDCTIYLHCLMKIDYTYINLRWML